MSNEQLILEIIEKVHEQNTIHARKIDELQIEIVRQGEIHRFNSKNLDEHMARTEANEQRLEVIEKHVMFVNSAIKVIAAIGGLILFTVKILPYLLKIV